MPQASSRKSTTAVASRKSCKRPRKSSKLLSNDNIVAATSFLSKRYGLLPCFCDHDPIRMIKDRQALILSKSSNAFWHRKSKPKQNLLTEKQRNNSTTSDTKPPNSSQSRHFQTFRQSIVQRFKRKNKKKKRTITARSVVNQPRNGGSRRPVNSPDSPQMDPHRLSLIPDNSEHSSSDSRRIESQDNFYGANKEEEENSDHTLEPTISSFKTEQQNINATNNISRTNQETSRTTFDSSKKLTQTAALPSKSHTRSTRNTSTHSTIKSLKRKNSSQQKRTSKRSTSLSNKKSISRSKRKHPTTSRTASGSKTQLKSTVHGRSPFPDPNIFHSLPRLQNSEEITEENVHENHLCCKPITSVKDLSMNDKKKLIEHNYLTLISLLPIYLGSQSHFQQKIREKTDISDKGAVELERLMNEWGSARLFIGANSHYKTLTQTI